MGGHVCTYLGLGIAVLRVYFCPAPSPRVVGPAGSSVRNTSPRERGCRECSCPSGARRHHPEHGLSEGRKWLFFWRLPLCPLFLAHLPSLPAAVCGWVAHIPREGREGQEREWVYGLAWAYICPTFWDRGQCLNPCSPYLQFSFLFSCSPLPPGVPC